MPKIIKFRLKKKDYEELRKFLSKGRANARELKRAEVLTPMATQTAPPVATSNCAG